jgi:hypothetical protein
MEKGFKIETPEEGRHSVEILEFQGEFVGIKEMEMSVSGTCFRMKRSVLEGVCRPYKEKQGVVERYKDKNGETRLRLLGTAEERVVFDRPPRYATKRAVEDAPQQKKTKVLWLGLHPDSALDSLEK